MAVGDHVLFQAASFYVAGSVDITKTSGWRAGLSTATFGAVSAGLNSPQFGVAPLLEVTAGGNYPAGGIVLSTVAQSATGYPAGQVTLALNTAVHADGKVELTANASNPNAARTMVIYDSDAANNAAIIAIDITEDGSTPINCSFRKLSISIDPQGTEGVFLTVSI